MNREIKFRGFQKTWIYGGITIFQNEATIFDINCVVNSAYEVDINSVGQFTGLKDKNGVDIYEGDILYNGFNAKGVMKFENGAFICEFQYENKSKIENEKHKFRISNINSITEIIGNIYENPELLK